MKKVVFSPADILIPHDPDAEKWSVIACDQFSSEPEYWERVRDYVGDEPSTLNMIIPEAHLGKLDIDSKAKSIRDVMLDYIEHGVFRSIERSFVYVERTLSDGRVRRGLVGAVDLDSYDFSGSKAAILASEGTVLDRLPARVRVRSEVPLELPHIMAFINDKNETVIEPLSEKSSELPLLYDFDLVEGGGHIKGMRVAGADADAVIAAMISLHDSDDTLMVIGDGNHSLAAAKVYWDDIKRSISAAERSRHPARQALVEINNVFDHSINFEAIHRLVFDTDVDSFVRSFIGAMKSGADYTLLWIAGDRSGHIGIAAACIGDMLTDVQEFLDEYIERMGCNVDYIHGEESAMRLARGDRSVGLILPSMDKSELFATVRSRGVFPKKSFSVGHAEDKRYYLECRQIAVCGLQGIRD